jgi:hypothetical protein
MPIESIIVVAAIVCAFAAFSAALAWADHCSRDARPPRWLQPGE